jgi:FkbM family methyltransferase
MKKIGDWWLPSADQHFVGDISSYQLASYQKAMGHVRSNGTAIDVGAHIGIFSRRMAKAFTLVHSFEPDAHNYACLVRNVSSWTVRATYGAAGAQRGMGNVRVDAVANTGARGFESSSSGSVPMFAVDEFDYYGLGLMKIDTEGYEHRVLVGALETLKRHKPVLIIERPQEDSLNVLRLVGYRLVDVVGKDSIFVEK